MNKDQQQMIEQEAEFLTNKKYLGDGYFGGRAVIQKGIVVGLKLFDHQGTKQMFINKLTKENFGKESV
jgi:hypothetical protein